MTQLDSQVPVNRVISKITSENYKMAEEADLLSIGRHCSVSWCKRLDFLPFNCGHCKLIFCLDHRMPNEHECQEVEKNDIHVPVCPLCGELIKKAKHEGINSQVEKHIMSGCKDLVVKKAKKTNKCSLKSCRQNELMPYHCNQCGNKFCIRHRHAQDHLCTVLRVPSVTCSS